MATSMELGEGGMVPESACEGSGSQISSEAPPKISGREFYHHIAVRYINAANDLNSLRIHLENEVTEFLEREYKKLPFVFLSFFADIF
jgi:hypothetical protein